MDNKSLTKVSKTLANFSPEKWDRTKAIEANQSFGFDGNKSHWDIEKIKMLSPAQLQQLINAQTAQEVPSPDSMQTLRFLLQSISRISMPCSPAT